MAWVRIPLLPLTKFGYMRSLIFALLFAGSLSAQVNCVTIESGAFKHSISKEGKTTDKECLWVTVCEDVVEFRVSHTSIQTFLRVEGSNVWVDSANKKLATRLQQEDGLIVFWKNEKTAFAYTPAAE